jgi:hypothetical protein
MDTCYFTNLWVARTPGPDVIEHFIVVIDKCLLKAEVFPPGELFLPCLMFASKAGAFLRMDHLKDASLC